MPFFRLCLLHGLQEGAHLTGALSPFGFIVIKLLYFYLNLLLILCFLLSHFNSALLVHFSLFHIS